MAELTQTPASVAAGETTFVEVVQVGEAVTQGMPGYKLSTDGKYYKAITTSAAAADVKGVFLTPASANGYAVIGSGPVNVGATLTQGVAYYASGTAGKIELSSDIASGEYVTLIGIATSSSVLDVRPIASGVTKP